MNYRNNFKHMIILGILALMIAACGGSETQAEPTAVLDEGPVSEQADVVAAAEEAENETQDDVAPATLTPTPAAVDEPAPEEDDGKETPAAPSPEPADRPADTPVPAVTFNGTYEETYYRGAADAPVTMFDYSDFL